MSTAVIKDSHFELLAHGIKPDDKKRLFLGKVIQLGNIIYNVYRNRIGQIVLDPRKDVPAYEAWLFENKKALTSVKTGLKQSVQGKTKYLGSFAKHAKAD